MPAARVALVALCLIVLTGYTPPIGAGRAAAGCASGAVRRIADAGPDGDDGAKSATLARINRASDLAAEAAREQASLPLPAGPDRAAGEAYIASLMQPDSADRARYCGSTDPGRTAFALASHYRFGWAPVPLDRRRAWLWYAVAIDAGDAFAVRERAEIETAMTGMERAEAGWMLAAWQAAPVRCGSAVPLRR